MIKSWGWVQGAPPRGSGTFLVIDARPKAGVLCLGVSAMARAPEEVMQAMPRMSSFEVIVAMQAHTTVTKVQAEGCSALHQLAYMNNDARKEAVELGALDVVVTSMREHIRKARVQERGCAALYSLLFEDEVSQDIATAAGVGEALVAAMTQFPWGESVQDNACKAIQQFVRHHRRNQRRAGDAGAAEAVVTAMKHHRESESIGTKRLRRAAILGLHRCD